MDVAELIHRVGHRGGLDVVLNLNDAVVTAIEELVEELRHSGVFVEVALFRHDIGAHVVLVDQLVAILGWDEELAGDLFAGFSILRHNTVAGSHDDTMGNAILIHNGARNSQRAHRGLNMTSVDVLAARERHSQRRARADDNIRVCRCSLSYRDSGHKATRSYRQCSRECGDLL